MQYQKNCVMFFQHRTPLFFPWKIYQSQQSEADWEESSVPCFTFDFAFQ